MNNIENNKHLNLSSFVFALLIIIIIILSSFLIWSIYINDLYKEYEPIYAENCYKIEHDDNSVTVTVYYKNDDKLSSSEKYTFENGKMISCYYIDTYKSKAVTIDEYKKWLEYNSNDIKRTGKNVIEYEQKFEATDISYDSEYLKEKYESFTTNEEVINFGLENGKENNFYMPADFKRIN